MRKLRVVLVILLLVTFVAASQAGMAATTGGIADNMGIGKAKAALDQAKKSLTSGNSDIAKQNQLLTAYTKYMAKRSMGNATKDINAGKKSAKASIKPPSAAGLNVPLSGIGNAVKTLGSINMKIKNPIDIAKSIKIPRLTILD